MPGRGHLPPFLKRGPGGGYYLARPLADWALQDTSLVLLILISLIGDDDELDAIDVFAVDSDINLWAAQSEIP